MLTYLTSLSKGKITLWCYLIWYLVTVYFYFDPSPRLWLNSVGISAIIGFALLLSVARPDNHVTDRWQLFRLFMMPFAVSSFSSLIKGNNFIFIIPPNPHEQLVAVSACLLFVVFVYAVKTAAKRALA
ncbi:MAG: hypothetical protein V4628_13630 [Pseudomonadota bacterium]